MRHLCVQKQWDIPTVRRHVDPELYKRASGWNKSFLLFSKELLVYLTNTDTIKIYCLYQCGKFQQLFVPRKMLLSHPYIMKHVGEMMADTMNRPFQLLIWTSLGKFVNSTGNSTFKLITLPSLKVICWKTNEDIVP